MVWAGAVVPSCLRLRFGWNSFRFSGPGTESGGRRWEAIEEELVKGGKVSLAGFGNFEVRHRSARTGRNPQTGEEAQIAASKAPAFKAAKRLKEAVNN